MYPILDGDDCIRLLVLKDFNRKTSQLEGHLFTARLRDSPLYYALSYEWGSSKRNRRLRFQNYTIKIGENLFECLKQLHTSFRDFPLWVDQVCINQKDGAEKAQQVRLMPKIYPEAKQVIGWLGRSTPATKLALNVFRVSGLLGMQNNEKPSKELEEAVVDLARTGHIRSSHDLADPTGELWQATVDFARLSWFKRFWIVQEVVLATQLELRCGPDAISGDMFFAGVELTSTHVTAPPNPMLLEPFQNALRLGKLRRQVSAGNKQSFPSLAHVLSGWECGMDHDRLNALYGVAFRDSLPESVWFRPRYDLSVPLLYEQFARSHILSTNSLEILHFVCVPLRIAGPSAPISEPACNDFPSWIPNWRIATRPLALLPNVTDGGPLPFSATATKSEYVMKPGVRELSVRVRIVDEVVACGTPYSTLVQTTGLEIREVFKNWYKLTQHLLHPKDFRFSFASTMLMEGRVMPVERTQITVAPTEILEEFRQWEVMNIDDQSPYYHENGVSLDDDQRHKGTRFGYLAEEVCRNRTFFITKRGLMGLGPLTVSRSTSVVMIHGLRTPFAVQRWAKNDTLLGECYLHGLMDERIVLSDDDTFLNFT